MPDDNGKGLTPPEAETLRQKLLEESVRGIDDLALLPTPCAYVNTPCAYYSECQKYPDYHLLHKRVSDLT